MVMNLFSEKQVPRFSALDSRSGSLVKSLKTKSIPQIVKFYLHVTKFNIEILNYMTESKPILLILSSITNIFILEEENVYKNPLMTKISA